MQIKLRVFVIWLVAGFFILPLFYCNEVFEGTSGGIWPDNNGFHINAHGGGIFFENDTYYWFGEHKVSGSEGNRAMVGVHVYSSENLRDWDDRGIALSVSDDPDSPITVGCTIERPKVIYNEMTDTYVMWFHLELKDQGYRAALTGLAISKEVTGPYEFLESLRPHPGIWPINMDEGQKNIADTIVPPRGSDDWKEWVKDGGFLRRDFKGGQMSRDMTLFVDDDGTAYHITAAEENQTLHISELSADYQSFTDRYMRVLPAERNEAPAVFKYQGRYYMITSGLTGWKPNPARSAIADSLFGEWTSLGNPCRGSEDEINSTFESQSTYALVMDNEPNRIILMADRWRPENPIDGRYIWFDVRFEGGKPVLKWEDIVRF